MIEAIDSNIIDKALPLLRKYQKFYKINNY